MAVGTVLAARGGGAPSRVASVMRRSESGTWEERADRVIEEELVDVFVNGARAFELVCSPSNLYELAIGRLFTDGRIDRGSSIDGYVYDHRRKAIFLKIGSSDPEKRAVDVVPTRFSVGSGELLRLMGELEASSRVFHETGGAHSAALACDGSIVARFDDMGRFNALDKLAGWCFRTGVDASRAVLLFSGRVPYEVVAKAVRIGCPVIASPGAPTNLSIERAERAGVTIAGFVKGNRLNVYTCRERISDAECAAVC